MSETEFPLSLLHHFEQAVLGLDATLRIRFCNRAAEIRHRCWVGAWLRDGGLADVVPHLALDQAHEFTVENEQESLKIKWFPLDKPLDEATWCLIVQPVEGEAYRRKWEHLVLRAAKMNSVAGLAAGVAHEVNNPLGGILQSAQLLARGLDVTAPRTAEKLAQYGFSEEEIAKLANYVQQRQLLQFTGIIEECSERVRKILNTMLSFSRHRDVRLEPTDLPGLLDQTMLLAQAEWDLKKKYNFRQVQVETTISPDLRSLTCDPPSLQQVLLYLIKNAAIDMYHRTKEEPEGSYAPKLVLQAERENDVASIQIIDNGRGLPVPHPENVFDPFSTAWPDENGQGFGLSIAHFIIERIHKGRLTVESREREGSVFTLEIPQ